MPLGIPPVMRRAQGKARRGLPSNISDNRDSRKLKCSVDLWGWFIWALRRADTPISPNEPTTRLVTEGPFRYTRNPDYLSASIIYAGVASLANALWAILLLPIVLVVTQRDVIEREERYLERKFGEEYLRYKARVRRWI